MQPSHWPLPRHPACPGGGLRFVLAQRESFCKVSPLVLFFKHMEATADIGLIGLAVMGQNLVLNMNDHGYTVVVYNRTVSKVDEFLQKEAKGTKVLAAHSIE